MMRGYGDIMTGHGDIMMRGYGDIMMTGHGDIMMRGYGGHYDERLCVTL